MTDEIIDDVIEHWYPGLDVKEVHFLNKMIWCKYSLVPTYREEMWYHMEKDLIHFEAEMNQVVDKLCNKKIITETDEPITIMERNREERVIILHSYLRFWSYDFEEELFDAISYGDYYAIKLGELK